MINRSRPRRTAFAAGFVALSLVAASCGGSDEGEDDLSVALAVPFEVVNSVDSDDIVQGEVAETADDGCVNEGRSQLEEQDGGGEQLTSLEVATLLTVCQRYPNAIDLFAFTRCQAGGYPEVRVRTGSGDTLGVPDGDLVFFSGGIIRFHPVDTFSPSSEEIGNLPGPIVVERGEFYVIDEANGHGKFVSAVIREMTGRQINLAELSGVITESVVSDTLNSIAVATEDAPVFVNMSFGTYTCGPAPAKLQAALERHASSEHFVAAASAGNDGTAQVSWPAGFASSIRQVLSVGSVKRPAGDDGSSDPTATVDSAPPTRSCFSNYGDVTHWMFGEEVAVSGLGSWSGTSFAAPQALSTIAVAAASQEPLGEEVPELLTETYDIEVTGPSGTVYTLSSFCEPTSDYYAPFPSSPAGSYVITE